MGSPEKTPFCTAIPCIPCAGFSRLASWAGCLLRWPVAAFPLEGPSSRISSLGPWDHVSLTTENFCCRTCNNSAWRRAEIKHALREQQPNNKNNVPLPCKAMFCTHSSSAWPQSVQHLCFCFLCGGNCGLACTACPCLPP